MADTNLQTQQALWDVTAICPMDILFGFELGTTQDNPQTIATLKKMSELESDIKVDVSESVRKNEVFKGSEYVSTGKDVSTLRLFCWQNIVDDVEVTFHIFPNHVAVAEIKLKDLAADNADELDKITLSQTEILLKKAQLTFHNLMTNLSNKIAGTTAIFDSKESSNKVYWPSRTLTLKPAQLAQLDTQQILGDWLKDTHRPEDDERLVAGEIKESITWLKYVIVENDEISEDYRIETLILAQYCYSAQEKCNRKLRKSIEWAFQGEKKKLDTEIQRAKNELEKSRVLLKLHQVSVNECMRHLIRKKSRLVKDIFTCWEYDLLVENGNAMLDLCADKISESNSRQAKISASKTEYILIGISLFTVLDFIFFITQFSREAMANPTLDHNDGGPSDFLTFVADVPADWMFFIAVMLAGLIFVIYKEVKG